MRILSPVALLALALVGCSTGATYTPPGIPPAPVTHLYVGNGAAAGNISQFNLPLTAGSTANFSIPTGSGLFSLALDTAGHFAAGPLTGPISVVTALPLSASSVPSATFNNGSGTGAGELAFTGSGALYAPDGASHVYGFTPPFTNASVPSSTTTNAALLGAIGLGFDTGGNMIVSNVGGGGSNLVTFASPYTGAPTAVTTVVAGANYRKIAVSATQVFVANVTGTVGIAVYTLPLTNASVPAFTIPDANIPEAVNLDASGNLYVGNLGNSTVTVYAPPYSAASVPTTTLIVGSGAFSIYGMAIGP